MISGDPFLQQIVAAPGDEALRLIYADWLEERADPRGEFIRIWSEISRLPAHCEQYFRVRSRQKELRRAIDEKWLEQMGYVSTHRPLFTRLPARRAERWSLVEEFIEVWHGPLQPGHGTAAAELTAAERRLGFVLPAAVREWYALAGNRSDVWSNQDHLPRPKDLEVDQRAKALIFRYENQGCEKWGILVKDLKQEDPPVYQVYDPARILIPAWKTNPLGCGVI